MQSSPLNFAGQTLRGLSFQEQDLTGADFSHAAILGCNFSDARLVDTNFEAARIESKPGGGRVVAIGAALLATVTAILALAIVGSTSGATVAAMGALFAIAVAILIQRMTESSVAVFALVLAIAGTLASAFAAISALTQGMWSAVMLWVLLLSVFVGFGYFRFKTLTPLLATIDTSNPTSFRNANLTCARFNGAAIDNADFSGAILAWVDWHGCQLSRCQLSIATKIVDLCCSRNGSNQSYRGLNLSQLNLSQAILTRADLSATDLRGTNLSDAQLKQADLSEANALGTDFSGAVLTDACIFGWGINASTRFDRGRCDRIYVGRDRSHCQPSCGSFAPGDFIRCLPQFYPTLDLLFTDAIIPAAFDFAFRTLTSRYPGVDLRLKAVEQVGANKTRVRLTLQAFPATTDTLYSELCTEFVQIYQTRQAEFFAYLQTLQEQIEAQQQALADLDSAPQNSEFLRQFIEFSERLDFSLSTLIPDDVAADGDPDEAICGNGEVRNTFSSPNGSSQPQFKLSFPDGIDPRPFDFACQRLFKKYGQETHFIQSLERRHQCGWVVGFAIADPHLNPQSLQTEFFRHYDYAQQRLASRRQELQASIQQVEQELKAAQTQPSQILQTLFHHYDP